MPAEVAATWRRFKGCEEEEAHVPIGLDARPQGIYVNPTLSSYLASLRRAEWPTGDLSHPSLRTANRIERSRRMEELP
jgi:hypothetical protein